MIVVVAWAHRVVLPSSLLVSGILSLLGDGVITRPREYEATIDGTVARHGTIPQGVVISAGPRMLTDVWRSELAGNLV
jgi:hypothetical protein